jgi:hypothetical protein
MQKSIVLLAPVLAGPGSELQTDTGAGNSGSTVVGTERLESLGRFVTVNPFQVIVWPVIRVTIQIV